MHLKSYFAGNVASALSLARQELGPEAMLVHSRKTPPEARHLGEFEVVVAVNAMDLQGSNPGASGALGREKERIELVPGLPETALASEVAELRRQIERMAMAVARSSYVASARNLPDPQLAEVLARLLARELDPELAHHVVSRMRAAGLTANPERLEEALRTELAGRFGIDARLGREAGSPKVVALVGPCGSGKTTALVKLAVRNGLCARQSTMLLSMDTFRVAAADQLRSYAAILSVGFQALDTTAALAHALEEHRHKELILIDTPGHGRRDLAHAEDLARFLSTHPAIDTHLVLSASTRSADLSSAVERFEIFRPRKLLFTKLDETESFGPMLNEAVRTGKAISFLSGGQTIPEDLEAATKDRILDLVLNGGRACNP